MTKLIVDGKEIDVPPEYTLLQACEAAGAEIPRFCARPSAILVSTRHIQPMPSRQGVHWPQLSCL